MKNLLIALSFALAGYLLSGCEGMDDLSALPDGGEQTDALKTDTILVKPDTTPSNTDTMTAKTDTMPANTDTKPATSCPATIQGTLVTSYPEMIQGTLVRKGVTYTILPEHMTATVTCDSKYDGYIPAGVTCQQLIQGYRTTQNYTCCIAYGDDGPDFVPYCSPRNDIGKSAMCSADGKFVGWKCW